MMPTLLVLVGLAGSGKTTAAAYFKKKKLPVIRMGQVTDKLLEEFSLSYSEKNEKFIREYLREKFGQDIYAKKVISSVLKLLKKNNPVVVEGMRNKEELEAFRNIIANQKLIFLDTDTKIRYKRLHKRKKRPLTLTEAKERDVSERKYFKLHNLKKYADYLVDNNGKIADLYRQLREILNKISYDQT